MADGGLAVSIDTFLGKRGSPLAGYGNVFVATGRKYGVDPRLVVGISGIESSFGKLPYGSYNAWGWGPGKPFGSWEEAITTVTQGLKKGYLSQGLTAPIQIANKYAPASDGNDPQHWADTVSQFIKQLGGQPSASRTAGGPAPIVPPSPSTSLAGPPDPYANLRSSSQNVLTGIARTGHVDATSMLQQLALGQQADTRAAADWQAALAAQSQPAGPAAPPSSAGASFPSAGGNPLPKGYLTRVGVQHPTDGLDGFPAHDYFGAAGSPVIAPTSGTIVRFSGHDPANGPTSGIHGPFGWSIYLKGDNGRTYYLTHLGSRNTQVGQRVQAGKVIGTIGDYAHWGGANHVHMGIN